MSGGVIGCPSCRRESPDTAAFCAGCGVSLGGSAEPATEERQPNQWVMHATFALDDLSRAGDAAGVLSRLTTTTRWRDAASAYAAGDRVAAADLLGTMNDRAGEAYARLRAAEYVVACGIRVRTPGRSAARGKRVSGPRLPPWRLPHLAGAVAALTSC